jgi:2',3'-cyclic-nucleotide 2'-phosphodiesterase (5'-nucleotidase family)
MNRVKLFVLLLASVSIAEISYSQKSSPAALQYKIEPSSNIDSNIIKMLQPYSDSIKAALNVVIGFSNNGLYKKPMESTLGNFVADGMRKMGERKFNKAIDVAFVNHSGIRSFIPKGEIAVKKIYELFPFDNVIVLLEINGDSLQSLLNRSAENGGWPISGIAMNVRDKKAINVLVNGKPINSVAIYTVATTDYVANESGDGSMLRGGKQMNIGYLLRDCMIECIKEYTALGRPIDAKTDNRISYAN